MPSISLTDFVDFVVSAGTPQLSKVRALIRREEYSPPVDFWGPLRNAIRERHARGASLKTLPDLLGELTDAKKLTSYPAAIDGYLRFVGSKRFVYFEPPRTAWCEGGLSIRVNPELGLERNGKRCVAKLYFKADPVLNKKRADVVLGLMQMALADDLTDGTVPMIVDVQRGKPYEPTVEVADLDVLVAAEAAAFMRMWEGLGGE